MTEMEKLVELLEENTIPFEVTIQPLFRTPQIWVPCQSDSDGDVICHYGSYGGDRGLLETLGFGQEDVCGYLTAQEAFELIKNFYDGQS